jgi:hypothetical protein
MQGFVGRGEHDDYGPVVFRIVRCSAHQQKTLKVAAGAGQKVSKPEILVSVHQPVMNVNGQIFVSACPIRHSPIVVLAGLELMSDALDDHLLRWPLNRGAHFYIRGLTASPDLDTLVSAMVARGACPGADRAYTFQRGSIALDAALDVLLNALIVELVDAPEDQAPLGSLPPWSSGVRPSLLIVAPGSYLEAVPVDRPVHSKSGALALRLPRASKALGPDRVRPHSAKDRGLGKVLESVCQGPRPHFGNV